MLVLDVSGAVDLGTQSAPRLICSAPLGPWQRIFANLPDQDLISRGAGYKCAVRREGQSKHRVGVNSHFKFGLAVRLAGVPNGNRTVLTTRSQKSFAVGLATLAWLPLQNRDVTIMGRGVVGATFTR